MTHVVYLSRQTPKIISPQIQIDASRPPAHSLLYRDHGKRRLTLHVRHRLIRTQSHTVDIPQDLKASLRKFRFARRNAGSAAMVVKINKQKLLMEEVEQFDNISIEDLAEGMSIAFDLYYNRAGLVLISLMVSQNCRRTLLATSYSHMS